MTQVIVYTNDNGNVSVCYPSGELPIEDVLAKDCPEGAIVIDADDLPQGEDDLFDAWRLINGVVTIDLEAARSLQLDRLNSFAKQEAVNRALNVAIGVGNALSDADFLTDLNVKRAEIAAAFSVAELRAVKV